MALQKKKKKSKLTFCFQKAKREHTMKRLTRNIGRNTMNIIMVNNSQKLNQHKVMPSKERVMQRRGKKRKSERRIRTMVSIS